MSLPVPIASASTLGGIKVGNNPTIDVDGVLSATGGGGTVPGGGAVDSVNGKTGTVVLNAQTLVLWQVVITSVNSPMTLITLQLEIMLVV